MAPEQAECATRRHVAEEKSERGSSVRNFSQKDSLSKVACQKFPSLSASKLVGSKGLYKTAILTEVPLVSELVVGRTQRGKATEHRSKVVAWG